MKEQIDIAGRMRLTRLDAAIAFTLGLGVAGGFAWLFMPGIEPSLWEETSVAASIVPPRTMFSGLWRLATGYAFTRLGVAQTIKVLGYAGMAAGAISVSLFFLAARKALSFIVPDSDDDVCWERFIAPFFAVMAAIAIAVSSPFWRMFQIFSPDALIFLGFVLLGNIWIGFLAKGGTWRLLLSMALGGALASETPFALPLVVVLILTYFRLWFGVGFDLLALPEAMCEPQNLPKWRMFFVFAAFIAGGVVLNLHVFSSLGGVEANDWVENDLVFHYMQAYGSQIVKSCTWMGWLLGLAFSVMPLVLSVFMAPRLVSGEKRMPFIPGLVLLAVFVFALLQTGVFSWATLWTQVESDGVVSNTLLATLFAACDAFAIAFAGSVFALWCREASKLIESERKGRILRATVPCITVLVLLLAALRLPRPTEIKMMEVVNDAVEETLRESGNAKWIFTDGKLDDALRLAVAAKGGLLAPLDMMSGSEPWKRSLRERAFPEESVERDLASQGIPVLLRTWYGEKPERLDETALQLGFDMWKRDRKPLPVSSGLVARQSGLDTSEVERGRVAAREIANRMIALGPKIDSARPSKALMDAFTAVGWRISRFSRLSGDDALADALDDSNSIIKNILSQVEYERRRAFMMLSPAEGLQLALRRADFSEARKFASVILKLDEDNPEANFAMGMWCAQDGELDAAERYLRRCLIRRPDEPVVLNNLSIVCRKLKRYDEALELAERSLRLLPESQEVKRTLHDAQEKAP